MIERKLRQHSVPPDHAHVPAPQGLDMTLQVTLPARGILKGSVQNTSFFDRASREELTAMVSSIGSSGGMTDVTIMVQFKNSLKRLRSGSCNIKAC